MWVQITSNHDVIYVFWISPLRQIMVDSILIINVQKAAFRSAEEPREILNGVALRRCINDTEHLLQVILDQLHRRQSFPHEVILYKNVCPGITLICSVPKRGTQSALIR
jgi:hypothetical protein